MSPTANADAAIAVAGATLAHGRHVALRDVSLTVAAGATTALIGPNGAGKSTLLHALAGLLAPSTGTITIGGRPVSQARQRVAYVLQSTAVADHLPVTVAEVVTMGRYAGGGAVGRLRAVDRARISEAIERLELGGLEKRHLGELSGGQRQRVFVAQGLAQDADVLLLDEAVAGLDLPSRQRILDVVAEERAAGRLVVSSTHDLGDAADADHVVLLAGRIVAAGTPRAVLTRDHLTEAYGARLLRIDDGLLLLDDGSHH
ncbi:MAG: metal ABC transporter ATP-binding protein [Acidimicrobiia bacterium]|nr:metal ABC transporter ATP-binding protein [Acidimicrobiia bacterium]